MPTNERPSPPTYVETYPPTGEPVSVASPTESTSAPPPSAAPDPSAGPSWNSADPWGSMRSTAEQAMRRFQGLDPMTRMGLGAAALAALGGVAYAGSRAMGSRAPARAAVSPFAGAMRGIFGGAPRGAPYGKPVPKKPIGYGWGKAPVKKPWW